MKWEYLVVDVSRKHGDYANEKLDGAGVDGWELVSVVEAIDTDHDHIHRAYMKRPLEEPT